MYTHTRISQFNQLCDNSSAYYLNMKASSQCSPKSDYINATTMAEITPSNHRSMQQPTSFSEELMKFDSKLYDVQMDKHDDNDSTKKFICKYTGCGKEFKRTQNLVVHLRMHYEIKSYTCTHCGKGFIQKGNLQKHLKQHLFPKLRDRKMIKCDLCDCKFTEKYNLQVKFMLVILLIKCITIIYFLHQA